MTDPVVPPTTTVPPPSPPPPPPPPSGDEKKVPGWVYPRIDQLTGERKAAVEAAEREKARADKAEAEAAELKAAASKHLKHGTEKTPKPDSQPVLTAEQIEKITDAKAAQRIFDQRCAEVFAKGKSIDGFETRMLELNKAMDKQTAQNLYAAVLEFDNPEKLIDDLAKDIDGTLKLTRMSAIGAVKELTQRSIKLAAGATSPPPPPAPPPMKPGIDPATNSTVNPDLYDKNLKGNDWFKARQAQIDAKKEAARAKRG